MVKSSMLRPEPLTLREQSDDTDDVTEGSVRVRTACNEDEEPTGWTTMWVVV